MLFERKGVFLKRYIFILLFVCMYMCPYVCIHMCVQVPTQARRGSQIPEAGVSGSYEAPVVGTWK